MHDNVLNMSYGHYVQMVSLWLASISKNPLNAAFIVGNVLILPGLGLTVWFRWKRQPWVTPIPGALFLALVHLNGYYWLGQQLNLKFIPASLFSDWMPMLFALIACGLWLFTFPFDALKTSASRGLARISLFVGLLVFIITVLGMTLSGAFLQSFASVKPLQSESLELLFLWSAIGSSLLAAGLVTGGLQFARQSTQLSSKMSQYQTLSEQHLLVREVFDLIHSTNNRDLLCQTVLKAVLGLIQVEGACIAPCHPETRQLGSPLAAFPAQFQAAIPESLISLIQESMGAPVRFKTGMPLHMAHGMAFPIQTEHLLLGALLLYTTRPLLVLPMNLILLQTLCKQTAIALNRLQLQWEKGKAEERFSTQLHLTKSLAENLGLGIFAVNPQGELLFMNSTAETLLGWNRRELKNKSLIPLIQRISAENPKTDGAACNVEAYFTRKDGDDLPVYCASAPIAMGNKTQGQIYVFHDLSRQKQHEQELKLYVKRLEQSNQALEQFAYLASHDLQAPLIKLQQFSDMLDSKALLDEESQDIILRIQKSAQRMQALIQDILMLAKMSTNRKPFEDVDLGRVIRQVLDDYQDKINRLEAKIQIAPMPVLAGDSSLLQLLIRNLLDNALKFRQESVPPEITFHCEYLQLGFCQLTCQDNGIGFSSTQSERIFEMFERLHGVNQYPGNGIGLSLCKKVVEQHNGTIRADGKPQQGAKFVITLPLRQDSPLI